MAAPWMATASHDSAGGQDARRPTRRDVVGGGRRGTPPGVPAARERGAMDGDERAMTVPEGRMPAGRPGETWWEAAEGGPHRGSGRTPARSHGWRRARHGGPGGRAA